MDTLWMASRNAKKRATLIHAVIPGDPTAWRRGACGIDATWWSVQFIKNPPKILKCNKCRRLVGEVEK